jgi:acyl-CoA reductase-like NAD-dependent aldehyde dehydrogenase
MQTMLINGARTEAVSGATRCIDNPATREPAGIVSEGGVEDLRRAVAAAQAAQPAWDRIAAAEKGRLLADVAARIRADADALSALMTRETGSPLCESADCISWAAACFESCGADLCAGHGQSGLAPAQVIAALGSFYFPMLLLASSVAPALAAGNAVVCKPPPQTALSNLKLAEAYEGLPPGVVNVTTGGPEVDRALMGEPEVALITWAGPRSASLEVARGAGFGRLHFEAGATGPAIVLQDADLELAVPGVAWERLRRCGQDGATGRRIYVHASRAAEFADRIHEYVAFLEVGDPIKPDTDLGPLISLEAARRLEAQVAHAAKEGARLKLGGRCFSPWGLPGHFFQPTILTDVRPGSAAVREEMFGPVLLIIPVASAEEALRFALDDGPSFTASVYTSAPARALQILESSGREARWMPAEASGPEASIAGGRPRWQPPAQAQFEHVLVRKPWWFPYRDRRPCPPSTP